MASPFLTRFAIDNALTDLEHSLFSAADVRSAEDLESLVHAFPSLALSGVRLPLVSNATRQMTGAAYAAATGPNAAPPAPIRFGAIPPPGAAFTPGARVGMPAPALPAAPAPPIAIDLRPGAWPVRDQGGRGTCVAFAATACVEQKMVSGGNAGELSEQFLYWAIKNNTGDPYPLADGTWLEFARDALRADGICDEVACPYVPSATPAGQPVGGPSPSPGAVKAAAALQWTAATWQRRPARAAATLLSLLQRGRVAAVSLPVFVDSLQPTPNVTNWTLPVGWMYGRVLNPPVMSVVDGGHCVCVTGFVPDANEPNGGYFIIRNSWDTQWGSQAPAPGSTLAPEPGYGEVSATYVETYCWELFQL